MLLISLEQSPSRYVFPWWSPQSVKNLGEDLTSTMRLVPACTILGRMLDLDLIRTWAAHIWLLRVYDWRLNGYGLLRAAPTAICSTAHLSYI